jgi:HSP20 family protein
MLTMWNPFSDLAYTYSDSPKFSPAVDISEENGALVLKAELPGVKSEDLEISVENNVLTLKGERKTASVRRYRSEQTHGTFTRRFQLPNYIDPTAIEADLSDGILTVTLPKRPEVQPRKIEVKVKLN